MQSKRSLSAIAVLATIPLLALAACDRPEATPFAPEVPARAAAPAPQAAHAFVARNDTITGERYVVRFNDDTPGHEALARSLAGAHGGRVGYVFTAVFKGFTLILPKQGAEHAVEAIRRSPRVKYVVADEKLDVASVQGGAGWALDRIDQYWSQSLDGSFNYFQTGAGVNIYVIDSGIQGSHSEFGGRFGNLTFTSVYPNDPYQDCRGHGTIVASAAAGSLGGVAKGATLNSLQVIPCSGNASGSDIASAIDFVTRYGQRPAVINLSLGHALAWYEAFHPDEDAIRGAVASGVHVVLAAGNDGINACNFSPARVAEGITVGAVDQNGSRAVWNANESSDWGSCVDVWAPGSGTFVARNWGGWANDGAGTSIATPYVTGTVALILSERPALTPSYVQDIIKSTATGGLNYPTLGSGSPNRFLYSPHTQVTIGGYNAICRAASGTYTWTMNILGGGDVREYDWYIGYNDGNDEIYPGQTNAPSFTQYISTSIGNFEVVASLYTYGGWRTIHWPVSIVEC